MLSAEIAPILVTDRAVERLCNASRILFNALKKEKCILQPMTGLFFLKIFMTVAPVFWIWISIDMAFLNLAAINRKKRFYAVYQLS
jgi:hypothetical protein